jgi:hypothetical protein
LFVFLSALAFASARTDEEENTLKCLVAHLKSRGIQEDFFESISTDFKSPVDCPALINAKLAKAHNKIETKLNDDPFFSKFSTCIMTNLKRNDENTAVMLRREAIKLNGLGIQVWKYFNQKEYLDKLKKIVEDNLNNIAPKCIANK